MWGVFPLNLNRQPGHRRVYLARLAGLLLALTLLVQGAAQQLPALPPQKPPARLPLHLAGVGQGPFHYLRGVQSLPEAAPTERVMFTLEGPGGKQALTLKQLKALPAVQYTTWHPQLRRFFRYEGVPLRDLAALGGFLGKDLRLHASNNFVSTIHAQDYLQEPIMLAYLADGKPIPVMEKGPLTVVLPPRPERFSTPAYSGAWVWFAIRLTPAP